MKTKIKRQRPERKLRDVSKEHKLPGKGNLIDKQFTSLKAAGDGSNGGLFEPTESDMAKINEFTARPVSAEEVACFNTLSCNDLLDRDDDRFTKDCVDDFAKLKGDLSPVGKSFMVGHDYTKLPVGRIFGVGTTDIDSTHFLTNKVYVPRIAENETFLANQEFGIYWAVSVGVMLEDSACSVCQSPMVGNYWVFCMENGHEKGLWYDPDSDEKDGWGWAEPVEPGTKGAKKCTRDLYTPKDFYELSQVFLGAQYGAEIGSKSASFKGILKAASTGKAPVLNLALEEAKELPLSHVSEEVREAYASGFAVKTHEDGSLTWTDGNNLVWSYDPEESEVFSLGEKKETDDEGGGDGTEDGREPEESDDKDSSGSGDALGSEDEDGSSDPDESEGDDDESDADPEEGVDDSEEDDEEDDEEEEDETKAVAPSSSAVLTAARKANIPEAVIKAASKKKDVTIDVLLAATSRHIKSLEVRAALGTKHIESKRDEALRWYIKAAQTGGAKKVKVKAFKSMLDREDDVDILDEVISEQKGIAQAKFPASVRRSTVERDPEEVEEPEELPLQAVQDERTAAKARRLHG